MSLYSHWILEEHGAGFKFPVDFGHNMIFEYEYQWGNERVTDRLKQIVRHDPKKGPREADLKISSWAGTSFGAVHHYARIDLGYNNYVYSANGKPWHKSVGYGAPWGAGHTEFEITRPADKRDLKHDKDMAEMSESPIYGRLKLGEFTHGFWTEEEAMAAAIKFFKEHFEPGWILVPDAWSEDTRPEYART